MFTLTYLLCMCVYKHGYKYVYIGGLHSPPHQFPSNSIHIPGFHYHLQKVTHRCVSPAQTSPLSSGPIWHLHKLNTHHFIILLLLPIMRKGEVKESLSPFHVVFFFFSHHHALSSIKQKSESLFSLPSPSSWMSNLSPCPVHFILYFFLAQHIISTSFHAIVQAKGESKYDVSLCNRLKQELH